MKFSLAEIGQLLEMRDNPQNVRQVVRKLTHSKLAKVEGHAEDLATLLDELRLMMNLGANAKQGCPIIDDMDQRISDDC
jgi:DNA-binding transcriptional MerR regulator